MAALNIGRQVQGVFDLTNEEEVCPEERNILAEVFEKLNLNENKWMQDVTVLKNVPNCNWKYAKCTDGKVQEMILTSMALSVSISASIGNQTHPKLLNLQDN